MNVKYNPKYHDDWAWSLAMKGATDQEIADAMGVSRKTINRWSWRKDDNGDRVRTSFGEALAAGKDAADAKVERKLYERCLGYDVEEVKQKIEHDKNGRPNIVSSEVVKKHIPPDTMAIMYWLNNRSKKTGEWSQRQDIKLSNGDGEEDVLIYLPANGRDGGD